MMSEVHVCARGRARPLYDARGIFCAYVCDQCLADKRDRFRADIFVEPDYWHDEPVDDD